jgi:outer membrane protein
MQARNVATTLGALILCAAPLSCVAGDTDLNNQFRIGLYYIHYFTKADDISGPFVPPGVNLSQEDTTTLYLAYVRRLSPHFNVELAFGWPPLTRTDGKGPATLGSVPYNGVNISTARWAAPTLLFNYMFLEESQPLRPYVGIGVNYTRFYSVQSTQAGNEATGGPTSLSLPSSFGPAATVGLAYHPFERWGFYLSYSLSDVHTKLTADTAGLIRTTEIHFWPGALVASGGFSF